MEAWIVRLSDSVEAPRSLIGGKAAGLAELQSAGFPVPEGFCITTAAYAAAGNGEALSLELRAAILDAYEALGSPVVAVRSSAVEEDSAEHSFSGIYDTRLNIDGEAELLDAVQHCWHAYDSVHAVAYRRDAGVVESPGIALLVQPIVPAHAAGVVFTANPTNNRFNEIVVNSTFGLAEPLVSGEVDADQFVLSRADGKLLSCHVGRKETYLQPRGRGIVGDTHELDAASLRSSDLDELRRLALRVEAYHDGYPQDIEWAKVDDRFFILQSRPITTLAPLFYSRQLELWAAIPAAGEDPNTIWTRAYSDEVWTRPTSPLFYTTHNLTGAFTRYFRVVGHTGAVPVATFCYRQVSAYLDVKYLEEQAAYQPRLARVPGLLNMLPGDLRPRVQAMRWRWWGRLHQLWQLEVKERRSASLFRNYRVVDRQWPAWLNVVARWRSTDLDELSDDGLLAHLADVYTESAKVGYPCSVGVLFHAYDLSLLVQGLLRQWLGDNGTIFARITSGLDDSETVEEAHALWRIARQVSPSGPLRAAVREMRFEDLRGAAKEINGGTQLLTAIDEFLATHYHRGANYKDAVWSRWGDDPDLLLASIRLYLDEDTEDPRKRHERQALARKQATADVLRRLQRSGVPGPARGAILSWLLKYTRLYLALRDNHRFYYDFSHWEVRRTFLAMGRRLAERGCLHEPHDVFFLGQDEVKAALTNKLKRAEALWRATVRKRQFIQDRDAATPKFMRGDQPLAPVDRSIGGADITGLAAGPGKVTGVARVLRDVSELSRVGHGEILVTHQTDPGWTPLFTRLGALVLETGSVLAHGASLAREYGLPAVTAAEGATRLIADGDLLTVDGSNGRVFIHRG